MINEELHKTMIKVHNEGTHFPDIASKFAWYSQIVSAFLENNGSNNHLKKGRMHFGVRWNYCTDKEGHIIIPVPMPQV